MRASSARTRGSRRSVDGAHVLYHYLQKDLLRSDIWLFQMLTARLIVGLGVWLPPSLYGQLPVMLPYAVRDPTSRGDPRRGVPDQWGSPNKEGYFRDDNSLIKNIPKSLTISAEGNSLYRGARIGKGFVAAHVWRESTVDGVLASRHPLTYSFVPNIVWLPAQVAKLTDREGSFVQGYLQALSHKIYSSYQVEPAFQPMVEEIWDRLPMPGGIPEQGLPDVDDLNFFDVSDSFVSRRRSSIRVVRDAVDALLAGRDPEGKVISSRYTEGLPEVAPDALKVLRANVDALLPSPEGSTNERAEQARRGSRP